MKVKKRVYFKTSDGLVFNDPSRTQQQYKAECDVCRQIERLTQHLELTGQSLSDVVNDGAMYGDFSEIPNYRQYNNQVCDAKEKFDMLDPRVKEKFDNDPAKLFDFLLDPNNKDEAVKLGLVKSPVIDDIKQDITPPSDNSASEGSSVSTDAAK